MLSHKESWPTGWEWCVQGIRTLSLPSHSLNFPSHQILIVSGMTRQSRWHGWTAFQTMPTPSVPYLCTPLLFLVSTCQSDLQFSRANQMQVRLDGTICIRAWFPSSSLLLPIAISLDVWSEIMISPRPKCFLLFWWLSRRSWCCLFMLSTLRPLGTNSSKYTQPAPAQLQGLCLWVQADLGKNLSSVLNMY